MSNAPKLTTEEPSESAEWQTEYRAMCPSDREASDACMDLCTYQILRELLRRFKHTDGIDYCDADDLMVLYNYIEGLAFE